MMEKILGNKYLAVILFVAALSVYLLNTWGVSIYILDEAKNATCAREMLETKNAFVPTFNYTLRTDKPPLHYFFMMLAYKMFGVTPFAARFFSALFGALTILVTFVYTKRFCNVSLAFWTAIVLLASIHLLLQFHLAVPDPYLVFFMTWSLLAFFAAFKTAAIREILFMYFAIALGILAKGPVALLLPGLIFLVFLIFSRKLNWRIVQKFKPFWGVAIVLSLALPWFLVNGIKTNWEWTLGFLGEHNLNRFSGSKEGHGGSFVVTLLFVLAGIFPFSVFLPRAIVYGFEKRKNEFILFQLVAGICIVAFFSISQTKLPNYTVPAYPFLSVILAYFITQKGVSFRQIRIEYFVLLLLGFAVPIGAYFVLKYDPSLSSVQQNAFWFLVLPFGLMLAFFFKQKMHRFILLIAFSGLCTALVFFAVVFPGIDCQNPVSKSLDMLSGKEIAYYKKYNPAYSFYLKKQIPELEADEFEHFFQTNPEGIIISTKHKIEALDSGAEYEIVFSGKDLFELPTTVLIQQKREP